MKKILIGMLFLIGASSAALAADNDDAKNRCESVQNQPSQAPFMCRCTGGPGGYSYTVPAILGTAYGGPGNYRFETWICPQGCERIN